MLFKNVLILGYGYTAKYLKRQLLEMSPPLEVLTTSRQGGDHILFDFEDPSTWENLPPADLVIWTFPINQTDQLEDFWDSYLKNVKRVVIVGSTSAFMVGSADSRVNENSSLDHSVMRVMGEEFLRFKGGQLVLSSGIYGPGRNPIDWLKKGLVGKSDKFVNTVHVDDLCKIIIAAGFYDEGGQLFIASDNSPKRWRDIINYWESTGLVSEIPEKQSNRASKMVDSSETLDRLDIKLDYPDFPKAVEDICKSD